LLYFHWEVKTSVTNVGCARIEKYTYICKLELFRCNFTGTTTSAIGNERASWTA
jgi:hypothetical protein